MRHYKGSLLYKAKADSPGYGMNSLFKWPPVGDTNNMLFNIYVMIDPDEDIFYDNPDDRIKDILNESVGNMKCRNDINKL